MTKPLRHAIVVATVALVMLHRPELASPPLLHPERLRAWWLAHGPLIATFAAARILLLGVGIYLLVLSAIALLGRSVAGVSFCCALARSRLPGSRWAVSVALGASTLAGALIASTAGFSNPAVADSAGADKPPTLTYVGPATAVPATAAPTAAAPLSARRRSQPGTTTWVVRPGDDLWSIAAAALTRAWGRPPDLPELADYWRRVIEANERYLPVPADPSLLFPGDRIVIPTPRPVA